MDCPGLPRLGYLEFNDRLHGRMKNRRFPISGSLDLTERCNLGCAHCYINRPGGDREAAAEELTADQWRGLLDEMSGAGTLWLQISGGEPLLRPDFFDIYVYAKQKGFLITLMTNGTLITPEAAGTLAEWPPFNLEMTCYGASRETYERVTGVPGSHARFCRGLDLLMERGIRPRLKTMVMTLNRHELDDMRAQAKTLGLDFRYDGVLDIRKDGCRRPEGLRIPVDDLVGLDVSDERRAEEWRRFWNDYKGVKPSGELYQCTAGTRGYHIDPYGRMTVCLQAQNPCFDLRKGTFQDGWERFFPERVLSRRRTRDSPCAGCALSALCGRCVPLAERETGDPELPVNYLCEIAYKRAAALQLT